MTIIFTTKFNDLKLVSLIVGLLVYLVHFYAASHGKGIHSTLVSYSRSGSGGRGI